MLAESETDVSSIMPQKRNPRPLDAVRLRASGVVGSAHTVTLNAHNTNSGMNDYRPATQALDAAQRAVSMYRAYVRVLDNLVVSNERSLIEINEEYSTMTEVADVLLRRADVPFRVAHHYASELTTYGRSNGKRPLDLTDAELEDVYHEAIGEPLPIDVRWIRSAMNPADMVSARRGLGGPQPDEVRRMLVVAQNELRRDATWFDEVRSRLTERSASLRASFEALAASD